MSRRNLALLLGGLAVALAVVVVLAPNASSDPDGLQKVAADEGFAGEAEDAPFELLPGYSVPGVDQGGAATALAGVIGTLAVAAIALGAGWLLRRRARRREAELAVAGSSPSPRRT